MRYIFWLLLACLPLALSGQSPAQYSVQGRFGTCEEDTIRLFFLDGVSLRQVARTPVMEDENGKYFAFSFQDIPPGFFFVGGGKPVNTRLVVLGTDSLVFLQGNYENFYQANILYSQSNDAWNKAVQISNQLQTQSNQLNQQYQRQKNTGQDMTSLIEQMNMLDQQKLDLLDSLEKVHPLLRKAMAVRTYLSAPELQSGYDSELDFFARTYFSQARLADSSYFHMPTINEGFQSYANTLGAVNLPQETIVSYCEGWLADIPKPSPTHKLAILGLTAGFNGSNDDAFVHYGNEYLNLYPGDNPEFAANLQSQINDRQALLIGAVAPDLKLPTPSGDSLAISDLRGQVVLLDFWASWCRPCRVENPRVKAMYDKHRDQGFEILGFSLDRNKASWENAIADDGLPWYHVSDLKQWGSIASQTYKVGSIPYTVLLDREGRIVAKGLRGEALEAKVAQILEQQPSQE